MKTSIVSGFVLLFSAFSWADYQPYTFKCTYDASSDGMITVTSKIDPDQDDWTMILKSSEKPDEEIIEAKEVYVYARNEKLPAKTTAIIDRLAKQLKVDEAKWYTTTETIVFSGNPAMSFFKFNSKDGFLGIGIYSAFFDTTVDGEYFTECVP